MNTQTLAPKTIQPSTNIATTFNRANTQMTTSMLKRWFGGSVVRLEGVTASHHYTRGQHRLLYWLGYLTPSPAVNKLAESIITKGDDLRRDTNVYCDLGGCNISLALQSAEAYRVDYPLPRDTEANRLVAFKVCRDFLKSYARLSNREMANTLPMAVELCMTPMKIDVVTRQFGATKKVYQMKALVAAPRQVNKWRWFLGWRVPEPSPN